MVSAAWVRFPALGPFCVEFACSPCVCVGSLSGFSGFLPQSKNMHVRSIGDSKLSLGVNVSVNGCVSLCGPAMNWRLIQGVTLPSPQDSWDRLQLTPVTLRSGLSGSRKWMKECLLSSRHIIWNSQCLLHRKYILFRCIYFEVVNHKKSLKSIYHLKNYNNQSTT